MRILVRDTALRHVVIDALERGLTIKDAANLAGISVSAIKGLMDIWGKYLSFEEESEAESYLMGFSEAEIKASQDLHKAITHRNMRWIEMGESGGSPAKSAMWFLERRAGKDWAPPKQQVESHVVQESRNLSLEESLNTALRSLGVDSDALYQSGDYWARLATASSQGQELPSLPSESSDD